MEPNKSQEVKSCSKCGAKKNNDADKKGCTNCKKNLIKVILNILLQTSVYSKGDIYYGT